ncbi:Acyl-coenzyme A thioesterase 2, mitochondrial [Tupaia chinensis]|uniref:Acyl-coenzyme A thioesterase 2, mitochondrial n=1 Tax=Tupaia chinensis TaxID=246437 RepID=L8Y0X6_TUPCH|nr:Acyl-coenzyme A thioesterase 2, mitochondrial [Tupaia chinensis]
MVASSPAVLRALVLCRPGLKNCARLWGLTWLRACGEITRTPACTAATFCLEPANRSAWDEPVRIAVRGLAPGQPVTLCTSLLDEKKKRAHARYRADAHGELDLERAPALGGSFSGIEPMGLLWALQPEKPLERLVKRDVHTPFVVELEVLDGHDPEAGRVLCQPGPFPGIVDIFGVGGGLLEYRASLLAGKGFAVMALAYHNYEDLPKGVETLHLEYFEEAVNYLLNRPEVKGPGVGLLGISKGAELCLSMASFLKGITAAVIINGSLVNVGGTLHYKGETLPAIGINPRRIKVTRDGSADIVDVLNNPWEGPDCKSLIPVERAESTFLFLVGQDDHNWKSELYAHEASNRLQAHGKEKPQIICYPGAGHYIEPPYFPWCRASLHTLVGGPVIWGGEPRAHARAQVDAWKQLQTFFHKYLGSKALKGLS